MRIVIDMQGAQSESRLRGIGRYTLSFAQAIARNRGEHEVFLALSGLFPETIEPIRAAFDDLLPQENIRVWYAPGPVRESEAENKSRREIAELIREAFLASLNPDVIHISSLFEGYVDDAVTSIGRFDQNTPVSISIYDPIFRSNLEYDHSSNLIYKAYCQRKLDYQKKADIYVDLKEFALKEGSRLDQEAADSLWDVAANFALDKWANLKKTHLQEQQTEFTVKSKPRLAFVSPLPPERTGIADYSAALLPALSKYYEIEVIVAQEKVDTSWIKEHHLRVHDVAWLRAHAKAIDRVVYQMGNSHLHTYMLPLLREIPGVVVLHDFYLSGLVSSSENAAGAQGMWSQALYQSHGYSAVRLRFSDPVAAANQYPTNLHVIQNAQGLILHSEHSLTLAQQWYGSKLLSKVDTEVIPLVRTPAKPIDKASARRQLGIDDDVFLVCSFGFLNSTKLNNRLLNAWLESALAVDKQCQLVFVGENNSGDYVSHLLQTIRESGLKDRIRITGFASPETFNQYLAAADVAVQLRTNSRGETSAAVLDCMNYSLPLIVNANGSMAELDSDAIWLLADEFKDEALVDALETLWREPEKRRELGAKAQKIIHNHLMPAKCAQRYADAIEHFNRHAFSTTSALIQAIALQQTDIEDSSLLSIAKSIARTLPLLRPARRLFLDVSAICRTDLKTGIQRVVRSLVLALLDLPPKGYRVEPVYLSDDGGVWHYRFACRYTLELLDCPAGMLVDEVFEPEHGDILLGLDLSGGFAVEAEAGGLIAHYRNSGVEVYQLVYDLLPIRIPEVFPPETDMHFAKWCHAISKFDGAICISKAVADDLALWQKEEGIDWQGRRPFHISWFHLGADISNSASSSGLPKNAKQTLMQIKARTSFLMVGTIEPRKGHLQSLEAFIQLWQEGVDVNLVIVGKEGWKGLSKDKRCTITETMNMLRNHPELNKRLFWLEAISDEYLDKIYAVCTCLITASEGEGFGLPLIEAAQHKLPIIVRDIPVFREVAGEFAYYFSGKEPEDLAAAIKTWLALFDKSQHPSSVNMPWLTWKESAEQLKQILMGV